MGILLLIMPQVVWSSFLVQKAVYMKKADGSDYMLDDGGYAWCWGDELCKTMCSKL